MGGWYKQQHRVFVERAIREKSPRYPRYRPLRSISFPLQWPREDARGAPEKTRVQRTTYSAFAANERFPGIQMNDNRGRCESSRLTKERRTRRGDGGGGTLGAEGVPVRGHFITGCRSSLRLTKPRYNRQPTELMKGKLKGQSLLINLRASA